MNLELIFLFYIITNGFCQENDTLIHVQIVFRHGDRGQMRVIPGVDSNQNELWPNGLGQLTDRGIRQQFQLGQWLRKRYDNLLNKKYNHSEIYVRSTDVDRTLMSAESNLAGLYYDASNYVVSNLKWRPIPIHTMPRKSDFVMVTKDCDMYNYKKSLMYKDPKFYELLKEFQSTLDLIRNVTQQPNLDFQDLKHVFDALFCQRTHNLTMNTWVTTEIYQNLEKINKLDWEIMYYGKELHKLSGGLFLNELIYQMNYITKQNSKNRTEKMRIYSGHDTDLAGLLSAIGIYNNIKPPYASCFMLELWERSNINGDSAEKFYIKMFYKNQTDSDSIILPELKIKQCQKDFCNLSHFINSLRQTTLSISEYNNNCFTAKFSRLIFLSIPALIFLVLIILFCVFKSKRKYEQFN